MSSGRLVAIAIARQAKGPMENVESIEALAGQGLAGDRYGVGVGAAQFQGRGKPENEVTLIAREAIEAASDEFNLTITHLDTRRNLLTEGVPLNDLIQRTFRVGPVMLRGLELCEPCGYLERRTYAGIKAALKNRGGLRCCVVEGGRLQVGDAVDFERLADDRCAESDGAAGGVLVVDDHRDVADALVRLLTTLGKDARAAYDGEACLAEIERQKPAVVILDLGMPEIDGIELARRIRARADWKGITLVAMTGLGQEQDRARTAAAGFAAHLLKPVDLQLLEQTLNRLSAPQGGAGGSGAKSRDGGPANR